MADVSTSDVPLGRTMTTSPVVSRCLALVLAVVAAVPASVASCKPADSPNSDLPHCAPGQAITNEGDHYGCRNPCPPGQEASEGTVVRADGEIVGTCVASRQAVAEPPPPPPPAAPPPPPATPVAVSDPQSAVARGQSQQSDAQLDRAVIGDCLGKLNAIIRSFENTPRSTDEQAAATIANLSEAMDHQCGLIEKVKVDPGFGALVPRMEPILARSKRFQKRQEAEAARKAAEHQRWLQTPEGRRASCIDACANTIASQCSSRCQDQTCVAVCQNNYLLCVAQSCNGR